MIYKRNSESEEDMDELNEEDLIYIGDVDDVLEMMSDEEVEVSNDGEEFRPLRDDAHATLCVENNKSVFCVSIHPNELSIMTGTEDDKLHIWGLDGSLKSSFVFADSVIASEISSDGTLLASGDMAGNIKVYNISSEPYSLVFEYNIDDLQFLFWHDKARVLFAGSVTGDIYVLKVPEGDCKMLLGHGCKTNCAVMMPDGTRIAAGYDDGSVKIWDIKSSSVQSQVKAESPIITIDSHSDNNLVIIGTSEGNISLVNAATAKILNTVNITQESIESVVFYNNPELNFAAIGTGDGILTVWDVARNAVRHNIDTSAGIVKIKWLPGAKILSCHLDGCIRIHDARSGNIEKLFMGHKKPILDMCVTKDYKNFVTTSDDGTAKLFDVDGPGNVDITNDTIND